MGASGCISKDGVKASINRPSNGAAMIWFDKMLDHLNMLSSSFDTLFAKIGKVFKRPVFYVAVIAGFVWLSSMYLLAPPLPNYTPEDMARFAEEQAIRDIRATERRGHQRYLCHAVAACRKYSEARLECATAGNFKTCLRIKMGDDASYSDMCSGYDIGAPAVPLPQETPHWITCFRLSIDEW
jgi:hypothetical protein